MKIENIYLTHGTYDGVVTLGRPPNLVTAKKLIQNISKNLDKLLAEYLLLELSLPIPVGIEESSNEKPHRAPIITKK